MYKETFGGDEGLKKIFQNVKKLLKEYKPFGNNGFAEEYWFQKERKVTGKEILVFLEEKFLGSEIF